VCLNDDPSRDERIRLPRLEPGVLPLGTLLHGFLEALGIELFLLRAHAYVPSICRRLAASSALCEVPESFRFTAKLHRRLTHEREPDLSVARRFAAAMRPSSTRLAAVLAQFPFSFVNHPHNRAYSCRLRGALELPPVVELRNATWFERQTLDFVRGWEIGLATFDAPLIGGYARPSVMVTSELGYVRFHGRNVGSWWARDGRRYDYRYRQRELLSWLPRIREIARHTRETFVFFNNHRVGHAVVNAQMLAKLLQRSRKATRAIEARTG